MRILTSKREGELRGNVQACARRRRTRRGRSSGGTSAADELQKILLQSAVSLLRGGKIARLQLLAEIAEKSSGTIALPALLAFEYRAAVLVVMMKTVSRDAGHLLKVLL